MDRRHRLLHACSMSSRGSDRVTLRITLELGVNTEVSSHVVTTLGVMALSQFEGDWNAKLITSTYKRLHQTDRGCERAKHCNLVQSVMIAFDLGSFPFCRTQLQKSEINCGVYLNLTVDKGVGVILCFFLSSSFCHAVHNTQQTYRFKLFIQQS